MKATMKSLMRNRLIQRQHALLDHASTGNSFFFLQMLDGTTQSNCSLANIEPLAGIRLHNDGSWERKP